jgi:hypothetical protein
LTDLARAPLTIVEADQPYPFEQVLEPGPNVSTLPKPSWDTLVDRVLAICAKYRINGGRL